jgi:hypothetical protein
MSRPARLPEREVRKKGEFEIPPFLRVCRYKTSEFENACQDHLSASKSRNGSLRKGGVRDSSLPESLSIHLYK